MNEVRLFPFVVESVSDTYNEIPAGVQAVHAPEAWAESKGTDVVVAVIDTGCDYNHPDLKDRIVGGKNFSQDHLLLRRYANTKRVTLYLPDISKPAKTLKHSRNK